MTEKSKIKNLKKKLMKRFKLFKISMAIRTLKFDKYIEVGIEKKRNYFNQHCH